MNAKLTPDERADMVIHEMTQAEKIQMVHGIGWGPLRPNTTIPAGNNGGAGEVLGIPRLGIPDLNQADSAVGVRMAARDSRYATLLPSVLGAAAAWDNDAAFLYGDVIPVASCRRRVTTSRLAAVWTWHGIRAMDGCSSIPVKILCWLDIPSAT